MRRRDFVAWIAGALLFACLHPASANPAPGRHRVAFVNLGGEAPNRANLEAFREGLRELGYVEERNLDLDIRWGDNDVSRLPAIVASVLASKPAVVVSTGGPPTIRAIKAATSTLPVVFSRANRPPSVYFWKEFAELGGLASFATSLPAMYKRSATYVDRILKGAKPGDLPIEQPTTFELVLNRTAAKELGIEIPRSLLQRADLVIE